MTVRVICDTSCTIPEHYQESLSITQVPAWINFADGTSLRNGIDISDVDFYERLEHEKHLPTTAQPTPHEFAEAIAATGADEVIVAAVSSKLSGTYASAVQSAELVPGQKVYPFDTLGVSLGGGWAIIAGAELAKQGADVQTVLEEMARVRGEIEMAFVIDTLKYLVAGGRAPAVQGMVGSLLNIKPLLKISEGKIEVVEKVRGRKRSKRALLDRMMKWADDRPLRLGVINANVPDEASDFADMVIERLNVRELEIIELGPVVGILAGPGTLALAAYPVE
jgi:DegV family protein with EDD domain